MAMMSTRRGNLPVDLTSFVGRRRELAEAKRLLAGTRLLTLTGTGGVGKTRLALRVAALAERGFPDGVWLVELAALTEGELLARTVASELGVLNQSTRPALESVLDYVADKHLLLVLDNCEHLMAECVTLVEQLLGAAPHLRILATSRQALGVGGESVWLVPPLSLPDLDHVDGLSPGAAARSEAMTLFADRAAAVEPGFTITAENSRAVARLCQLLDGIPLAIEMAAVRLRALAVQDILARLDDRFRLLTSGSRAALPRHQTLRAAIDWSYELCSPRERVLWARLSVFSGGCDLAAAEAVCAGDGIAPDDVAGLMAGLVDKSILLREEHGSALRYQLLETVRQYGSQRLVSSGEQAAVRRRHRDYYRHLTARAYAEWVTPHQLDWYNRLQMEWANVRTTLDFCLTEPGEAGVALEIMHTPCTYWTVSGVVSEARRWLDRTLELAPEPNVARAHALGFGAWLALQQGDITAARRLVDECQALAQRLGDASSLTCAAISSARLALLQGHLKRAVALLDEALVYYRAHGTPREIAWCLYERALVEALIGDADRPAFGQELMAMAEAAGAPATLSHAMTVVGLHEYLRGDLTRATALILDALRLKQPFNDFYGVASCVEQLVWTMAAKGDSERAAHLFGAAQMLFRLNGTSFPTLGHIANTHDECAARLRDALGEEAFTEAVGEGAKFTMDQVFDYALGRRADTTVAAPQQRDTSAALTRREGQVAQLIAAGMSNKDIANTLVIAQRTAEAHVEHILTKLGFTSRAQVMAWVEEHPHLRLSAGWGAYPPEVRTRATWALGTRGGRIRRSLMQCTADSIQRGWSRQQVPLLGASAARYAGQRQSCHYTYPGAAGSEYEETYRDGPRRGQWLRPHWSQFLARGPGQ